MIMEITFPMVTVLLLTTAALYLASPGTQPRWKRETLSIVVSKDGFTRIDSAGRKVSVATAWKGLDGFRDLLAPTLTRHPEQHHPSPVGDGR